MVAAAFPYGASLEVSFCFATSLHDFFLLEARVSSFDEVSVFYGVCLHCLLFFHPRQSRKPEQMKI